ncbi:MAG: nitroreductase family protein [Spirochaetes bacterium]|jgi:nitroreductase|nr:nitroreductase family protein [Spirochaetota bacterium]
MDVIEALKGRRSINFFDPGRQIDGNIIRDLLEIANISPSSSNLQPWEIIVVSDPHKKKALRECSFNQKKVEEASAVFIVIANPNAIEENIDRVLEKSVELGYIMKEDVGKYRSGPFKLYGEKDSLKRKIFAVKNTSFFAMSIMIAARGLGLETHPMDGFDEEKIKKAFGIPDDRIIPLLITIGYPIPGLKLLPRAFRRKLDDFVKYNAYE